MYLRKFITIALCLAFGISFSQEDKKTENASIFDLEIPNNPAFILLDEAPETIQRPNSSRALGISLLQDVASDGVLNNIAIEVTPFWFSKNPNRSALAFYGIDSDLKQKYFSKIKMASISAAYVKNGDSIINVSIGARATLVEIKRKDDVKDYYKTFGDIKAALKMDTQLIVAFDQMKLNEGVKEFELSGEALKKYRQERAQYVNRKLDSLEVSYRLNETKMQEIIKRKPAFALDVAAAYNHRYYNGEFNNNGLGRYGVWSTLAGSFFLDKSDDNRDYLNLYGFLRYLMEEDKIGILGDRDNSYNAFDLGIKAELEFEKITVSYEYINRSGDLESYRSAGSIKYKAFDNIYLTGTFGNNFQENDDLITLFGIQWGLNNPIQSIGINE